MIYASEPATLTVTLVKATTLAPVASKVFTPRKGWQDITATFPAVPAGTYKPLYKYRGLEWLGEARTIKTTKTINIYTTIRGT